MRRNAQGNRCVRVAPIYGIPTPTLTGAPHYSEGRNSCVSGEEMGHLSGSSPETALRVLERQQGLDRSANELVRGGSSSSLSPDI